MSGEKLYGGKCHICADLRHDGEQADEPIPWLSMQGLECPDCSFCQERALTRHIEASGLYLFDREVWAAVRAFKEGKPHPLIDTLRKECEVIDAEFANRGSTSEPLSDEEWRLYAEGCGFDPVPPAFGGEQQTDNKGDGGE